MSMLSEHRRKTKWVVNPTKKPLWSTDSSGIKFGKELMEKMGWSAGKGLGLNEQGIQEPLRVSFKNDTKGMGFKGNDDDWIEHQDEFNSLLNQLRSGEDSSVVKISKEENGEIKSLEDKSKTSKARVHYQKFTRGKDLSKYSKNDLACILGTNKMKKEKPKAEEVVEAETKTNGNCETSFGVTTINSGSLQDYFKRKWIINKNKSDETNRDNAENSADNISNEKSSIYNGQSVGENEEKKSKKKKHKSEEQLPVEDSKISESDGFESSNKVEKRKRKKKENEVSSDNEPTKKKKRKNSDGSGAAESEVSPENNSILAEPSNLASENQLLDSLPKKGKKEKNYLKSEIADDEDESSCVKEKKKRKKKEKNLEEPFMSDAALEIDSTNDEEECKSSKRKYKKEKKMKNTIETSESCSKEDEPFPTQNDATESSLGEKSTKSKKIKKNKKENSEETVMKSTSNDLKEYSCSDENAEKFSIGVENDENTSVKKKKKKKDKKEKSNEEEFSCSSNEKSLAVEVDSTVEVESGKKKKKEKKEKLEENKCSNENEESLYENISEEPEKNKKKKKDKKEKSSQYENEENETVPEEGEGESVKKKKKKKKEKLQQKGNESQIESVEEPGSGTEKISERMDSNQIENNTVNSTKTDGEKRIEKLKVSLFGDEVSDKYFPEKGPNERVLKLIKWANISEFRGSNLRDVEGYGRKLMYQRQTR